MNGKYEKLGEHEIKTMSLKSPALSNPISLKESARASNAETGQPTGGIWEGLFLYENIESPYISGYVTVNEAQNVLYHQSIIGQETLMLEYRTPGVDSGLVKHELAIYKVGNRFFSTPNDRVQSYRLHFVSKAFLDDMQLKVHKSYTGNISDTVLKIWKEFFPNTPTPNINVSNTKNKHRFIIPHWTPFQAIDWLAERAVPTSNSNTPNFIFYADSDGYHFVPLSELNSSDVVQEYINGDVSSRDTPNSPPELFSKYTNTLEPIEFIKTADKMEDIANGVFASELWVHDIRDKTFINKQNYSYQRDFTGALEKYPIISASDITGLSFKPKTNILFYPTHRGEHDQIEDNNLSQEWLLQRRSLMEQRNSQQIKICVWGDSRRRVGDIVDFKTPSIEPIKSTDDWHDKNVSGKYMIKEIRHTFTSEEHKMWLTLSRDSFCQPIPDQAEFKGGSKEQQSPNRFLQQ
jgi:hypothetical protein